LIWKSLDDAAYLKCRIILIMSKSHKDLLKQKPWVGDGMEVPQLFYCSAINGSAATYPLLLTIQNFKNAEPKKRMASSRITSKLQSQP
jgi:hypothetical protein